MRTDSAIHTQVAPVIPLRSADRFARHTKRVRLPRLAAWRRKTPGQGSIALAELGRETGARC